MLHGLPRYTAYRLAGQMVAGTGQLLCRKRPASRRHERRGSSPGGTTIVGVAALERGGLRAAVMNAMMLSTKK